MKHLTLIAILAMTLSSSAFALTPKGKLIGKQFTSEDGKCTVVIEKGEYWKVDCDHLHRQYPAKTLSGRGLQIFNCYESRECEGVEFNFTKIKYNRRLQAFILSDRSLPGGIGLGLIYGSPADGMVEILRAN